MKTLNILKQSLAKEYDTKDLEEVKTIIRWQIKQDTTTSTLKIHQPVFIQDLVIEKGFINCNANVIPMKADLSVEMLDLKNYKETNLYTY